MWKSIRLRKKVLKMLAHILIDIGAIILYRFGNYVRLQQITLSPADLKFGIPRKSEDR